jgi:hypothetical protein
MYDVFLLIEGVSAFTVLAAAVCLGVSQRFSKSSLVLIAELIIPIAVIIVTFGLINLLHNMSSDPEGIFAALSLVFLPLLYAIALNALVRVPRQDHIQASPDWRFRALSFALLIALLGFYASLSNLGLDSFIHQDSVGFVALSIMLVGVLAHFSGKPRLVSVYKALTPIGLLGLSGGVLMVFANLLTPTGIGPSLAFGMLSLFLALWLKVLLRILVLNGPEANTDDSWLTLGLPFATITVIVFFALFIVP